MNSYMEVHTVLVSWVTSWCLLMDQNVCVEAVAALKHMLQEFPYREKPRSYMTVTFLKHVFLNLNVFQFKVTVQHFKLMPKNTKASHTLLRFQLGPAECPMTKFDFPVDTFFFFS